jgi:phage tail sheath gpL-like
MTISFNQIPATARVPFVYVEFDASRATQGVRLQRLRGLLIGQKLSTGTVAELVPVRITSAGQARNYFGVASQLGAMAEAWFANNRESELWAVAQDDPSGGVAAAGTITYTGTPTQPGTIYLYVAGTRLQVPVSTSDTPTTLATATAALIQASPYLPVTATSALGVVTWTARHAGVIGNEIDVRANYSDGDRTPSGITVAFAGTVTGTGDVDIDDVWPVLGEEQFNIIVAPVIDSTNLTALDEELEDRWGPLRQNDGIAFTAHSGSHATLLTFGSNLNSKHLVVMPNTGSPTTAWEWATMAAALVTRYGSQDPARPFNTLRMVGALAPAITDRFTAAERELLLHGGISTQRIGADDSVALERVITTYQENEFGAEDTAFLDVPTKLTLSFLRHDFRNYFAARYPRHKLADDGARFGAGQAVITPKIAKAEAIAKFRQWEELGLVENIDQFKQDLVVERNASDPTRLDFLLPPDLINQLMVTAVQVQFRL